MNFKILILIALVAFTVCNDDFLFDEMNSIRKEVKKGHRLFAKCLKRQLKTPDQDVKDLITALKEEDHNTIAKLTLKLWKEGGIIDECLKPKNGEENGIDWTYVLRCANGILGLIPCAKQVISVIVSKNIIALFKAILICPGGIANAIRGCIR